MALSKAIDFFAVVYGSNRWSVDSECEVNYLVFGSLASELNRLVLSYEQNGWKASDGEVRRG